MTKTNTEHKIIHMAVLAALVVSITLIFSINARAEIKTEEEAIDIIYDEIVEKGSDRVVFTTDRKMDGSELMAELYRRDKDSSVYDGKVLLGRGKAVKYIERKYEYTPKGSTKKVTKYEYEISLEKAFDVNEADSLIDAMTEEIKTEVNEETSEREKLYLIMDYVANTFKYDKEAIGDTDKKENFVDAYNGERLITCTDYATVIYLLSKKMGLDCRILPGKNHLFNVVRFSDSKNYLIVDGTSDSRYSLIGGVDRTINHDLYDISKSTRKLSKEETETNYTAAGVTEIAKEYIFFAKRAINKAFN